MGSLEREITELIIHTLGLEDVNPAEVDPTALFFGGDWGLDSVDALELGLMIQKRYGLKMDVSDGRAHFTSVRTLAAYVAAHA